MPFRAPADEFRFICKHIVPYGDVAATDMFAHADEDVSDAILTEAAKVCDEVLAPLQRNGDLTPAVLENGVVRTSPGFADGFKALAEGGWVSMSGSEEYGGMGLPVTLSTAVNDMMSGACLSLQLNPLMSQGQIEALEHHASDEMKALYLPKLASGEWCGTMNLTEAQAGSDVGALSSKATDNGDGTYAVTGQKIFISWADNDFSENVCHLVLARLPDGAPGTKGISLFLVPRHIPDADGNPGEKNSLRVVSLEHKLGLHGSPTAVMSFEGAKGWIVGEKHGGMKAMFTMMNNARLGVGTQGIGTAEAAYQKALEYALDRKQGRSPVEGGTGTIADHADVRRMLTRMKAEIFAARSIEMMNAVALDLAKATGDDGQASRAAFLTPITKAFGTDTGSTVANLGVQVHGGMGFIEETGAAQFVRDVRVTQIYEGTNGIQAMDFVARKMMDGGEMAFRILEEIEQCAEVARAEFPNMAGAVWSAAENMREATEWLVAQKDMNDRFAGAVPFLFAFARVLGACAHLRAAMVCGPDHARTRLARFYITRMLPEYEAALAEARAGAADLYALTVEDLTA